MEEIPEWSPGYSFEKRHIIVNNSSAGQVVTTKEYQNTFSVSGVSLFYSVLDEFSYWVNEYKNYEDFYGIDEDADGLIVEGNPQMVRLSFFQDGRLKKYVTLSGTLAYTDTPGGKFQIPASIIELRNKLLAYAEITKPQAKADYYITAVPYSANAVYWLLQSVKIESIPIITDNADDKDINFLNKVANNMPNYFPMQKETFIRVLENMNLPMNTTRATFRVSEVDDAIVQVRFMVGNPKN